MIDFVVAIDGVSGSGKSTVATDLAAKLGAESLDTGAMYRAVAWLALECQVVAEDEAAVSALLDGFEIEAASDRVMINSPLLADGDTGKSCDITQAIRTPEVTAAASAVAKNLAVRTHLQELQRAWVRTRGGGVVEGRDIGTAVFPEADYKFYLTASAETRASRRAADLGSQASAELPNMAHRDSADQSRQHSPLRQAPDAVEIDTTKLDVPATTELLLQHIRGGQSGKKLAASVPEASMPAASELPSSRPVASESSPKTSHNFYDFPAAKHYGQKRSVPNWLTYRFLRRLCLLLGTPYFRFRVKNRHNLPKSGPVIVAPGGHRSNIDTPFVGMAVRRTPLYMAKDSLFKSSFWSAVMVLLGGFPVVRDKLDRRALKSAQAALGRGEVLTVFPEGARQQGPKLQPLFEGVAWLSAKTGAPVLPLGIGGTERVMPIGVKWPRPRPVRMIFGELLESPGASAGGHSGSRRVPREELDDFTEKLSLRLQALFDEAQQWAGTPNAPASNAPSVPSARK